MKDTNKKFAQKNTLFKEACNLAGIPPTPRQASKYLNGKGLARRFVRQAQSSIDKQKNNA